MFQRLLVLPQKRSYFLFGARNTGKSTLVNLQYPESSFLINLLGSDEEARFARDPDELYRVVTKLPETTTHVIIDEVQKAPKLLDVVQRLMTETKKYFVMTGSSARKLKHGGANLLAGRAFVYHLFPMSWLELGDAFELDHMLRWGSLPEIFKCHSDSERQGFLSAYAHTYLKEEISAEQLVRQLDPFRRFLEVAAQCNGKVINFANMSRDVGVDDKTIKSYYSILEDTLIGFFLEPFHTSFRKRLSAKPKFYFFDPGVVRALARLSSVPLMPQTSGYGDAFEHFIILECFRLAAYFNREFRFSYLRTPSDSEIDLIVERPGKPLLCIEIKSAENVTPESLRAFINLTKDIPGSEAICLCKDRYAKKIEHVSVLPWKEGIKEYFA
ncbi:MAG TPA: AAA family ATPase [Gammaproteobacteria bacterium]|nr:AAA family ATPase [Gammaproteobacteria bacterium]